MPIIVGGGGKRRTPTLAARYAAEFNAGFRSVPDTGRLFEQVRCRVRGRSGRDPATLVHSAAQVVCLGRDDATVRRRAEAIGREVDELRENGIAGTPERPVTALGRLGGGRDAPGLPAGARPRRPRPPGRRARSPRRRTV